MAERMHAALAGPSTGVPTLVIGYSIKAEGILTDLLGAQLTKEKALISVQNFIAPGSGLAAAKSARSARKSLSTSLAASVPIARAKASAALDLIASIVRWVSPAPPTRQERLWNGVGTVREQIQ